MQTASPITITRSAPRGTEQVTYVDLEAVRPVIDNLLVALNAPAEHRVAYANYANALVQLRLLQWTDAA